MTDCLRLSHGERRDTFTRAFLTWSQLRVDPDKSPLVGNVRLVDGFPLHPKLVPGLQYESRPGYISVSGKSSWYCNRGGDGDIPPFNKKFRFSVSAHQALSIKLSPDRPPPYPDPFGQASRHIPVLLFAWAYILSARWVEIVMDGTPLRYMSDMAEVVTTPGSATFTCIVPDSATESTTRWWSAVLAPGRGWKAITETESLYSPWSVKLKLNGAALAVCQPPMQSLSPTSFSLYGANEEEQAPAPSPGCALGYLMDYCAFHDTWEQAEVALAAALVLPWARFSGSKVTLGLAPDGQQPGPQPKCARLSNRPINKRNRTEDIDRLLSLSCNTRVVDAVLRGIFYEPGVPANLCGSWIQGTFALLNSITNTEELMRTLMRRSPEVAFLWLGVFVCNAQEGALSHARRGHLERNLHGAIWTSTIQSFIQEPVEMKDTSSVSRADECRLLLLTHTDTHDIAPMAWPLHGSISRQETSMEVHEHVDCKDHGLFYAGWKWDLKGHGLAPHKSHTSEPPHCRLTSTLHVATEKINATRIEPDEGEIKVIHAIYEGIDHVGEDSISEMATGNGYSWLRRDDGFLLSERMVR